MDKIYWKLGRCHFLEMTAPLPPEEVMRKCSEMRHAMRNGWHARVVQEFSFWSFDDRF